MTRGRALPFLRPRGLPACGHDVPHTHQPSAPPRPCPHRRPAAGRVPADLPAGRGVPALRLDRVLGDRVLKGSGDLRPALRSQLEVGRSASGSAPSPPLRPGRVHLSGRVVTHARPHLTADLVFGDRPGGHRPPAALSRLRHQGRPQHHLGAIEAGTVHNAIPTAAVARGTLRCWTARSGARPRSWSSASWRPASLPTPVQLPPRLPAGAPPVVTTRRRPRSSPPRPPAIVRRGRPQRAPEHGGEDFSWYLEDIPARWPASASASPAPTWTFHGRLLRRVRSRDRRGGADPGRDRLCRPLTTTARPTEGSRLRARATGG